MITKILQNFTCSLSLFLLPIAPMTMEEIDSMEKDWMKATQTHRLKQTDKQTNHPHTIYGYGRKIFIPCFSTFIPWHVYLVVFSPTA